MNELNGVLAYLGGIAVLGSRVLAHFQVVTRPLCARLPKHQFKLSLTKTRLGAADVSFIGYPMSSTDVRLNLHKVSALANIPIPRYLKRRRSLLRGLLLFREFLPDMARRVKLISSLLKQGVKLEWPPAMEIIVCQLPSELARPPVQV